MRILKKLLLLHWYTYDREEISFEKINFLTGDTGSGKSTIIDAIQMVMLGDKSGAFFNKAANERSARSLKGYLFGEIGDDGEAGFHYIRSGRFTTYVVLEFYNDVRGEAMTAGYIADCFGDQTWKDHWFLMRKHGIPEGDFCDEKEIPWDYDTLRHSIGKLYKSRNAIEFYDTNVRFQENLLGAFGQVKRKYLYLFRKAVPFSPITNIEQFITESICNVENNIDIGQMQSDIREYKKIEEDARMTRERIDALTIIQEHSNRIETLKDNLAQQRYIVERAKLDEYREALNGLLQKKEELEKSASEQASKNEVLAEQMRTLTEQIDALNDEYRSSSQAQKERELRTEIGELKARRDAIRKEADSALRQVRDLGTRWSIMLDAVKELSESVTEETAIFARMRDGTFDSCPDLQEVSDKMQQISLLLADLFNSARKEQSDLTDRIRELDSEIQGLNQGIKPYPKQVVRLQNVLNEHFHHSVRVQVLADLLEIKDPAWQNAIEGYLDSQKFYLLVPQRYYTKALKVYDSIKKEENISGAGLIDIGKLREDHGRLKPAAGSLAEEIETKDPDARLYADYILGKVMKCEKVEDLNHYRTAITRSCMLYKNYVTRRLPPERYEIPFIGQAAAKKLLEIREEERKKAKADLEETKKKLTLLEKARLTPLMSRNEAGHLREDMEKQRQVPKIEKELAKLQEEYAGLDLTYLDQLKDQISVKEKELESTRKQKENVVQAVAELSRDISYLDQDMIPEAGKKVEDSSSGIEQNFDADWIRDVGEVRYEKEKKNSQRKSLSLAESFARQITATQTMIEDGSRERNALRKSYNDLYHAPYDSEKEVNEEYDAELTQLSRSKLPSYLQEIEDSRQKAYVQFRDDFIAKLKENIESVRSQIRELNEALSHSHFGRDSYQFEVRPRAEYKAYYDMIMDPLLMAVTGWNLSSEAFNEKYAKEIDSLFQMIIMDENVSAQQQREYEKNIAKYTDYRTYLTFDLIVTNDQGESQRLSRTLSKKSGGETQIPFYIAMLASFSQVLRVNTTKNDTVRLIVLDEAFSKMDSERIEECISLLHRFGLQAIFSAPSEKIANIAPFCDRTIIVYRNDREHSSFTRRFDPRKEMDFDDPQVTAAANSQSPA